MAIQDPFSYLFYVFYSPYNTVSIAITQRLAGTQTIVFFKVVEV